MVSLEKKINKNKIKRTNCKNSAKFFDSFEIAWYRSRWNDENDLILRRLYKPLYAKNSGDVFNQFTHSLNTLLCALSAIPIENTSGVVVRIDRPVHSY